MQIHLVGLIRDESAQGMVEYAMIIACVALASLVAFRPLAEPVLAMINKAVAAFSE